MKAPMILRNKSVLVCVALLFATVLAEEWDRNQKWCGDVDCYKVLGLDNTATHQEIKKAYKKLSLELHPDKNPDDKEAAAEKFGTVATSYEILSDPTKRGQYDKYMAMKRKLDAPRENPILVAIIIFLITTYLVKTFQSQRVRAVKKNILQDGRVVRLLNQKFQADLPGGNVGASPGDRKAKRKAERQKNKKNKGKDKKDAEPVDKVTNAQVEECLKELDIYAAGWNNGSEPNLASAATTVAYFPITFTTGTISTLRWLINYSILGQDYSFDDAQYLCAKANDFDMTGWNKLSQEKREDYLSKDGVWKSAWLKERARRE